MENIWVICGEYLCGLKIVYELVWVFFSEWGNGIRAWKFVPQQTLLWFFFIFCSNLCVDDSDEVEGVDLGTFGQTISPPPRFPGNDDKHDNFHDIDDLWS